MKLSAALLWTALVAVQAWDHISTEQLNQKLDASGSILVACTNDSHVSTID